MFESRVEHEFFFKTTKREFAGLLCLALLEG